MCVCVYTRLWSYLLHTPGCVHSTFTFVFNLSFTFCYNSITQISCYIRNINNWKYTDAKLLLIIKSEMPNYINAYPLCNDVVLHMYKIVPPFGASSIPLWTYHDSDTPWVVTGECTCCLNFKIIHKWKIVCLDWVVGIAHISLWNLENFFFIEIWEVVHPIWNFGMHSKWI